VATVPQFQIGELTGGPPGAVLVKPGVSPYKIN